MLEVSCGTGHNLYNFANYFSNVKIKGIDVSKDMIKKCQSKIHLFKDRIELINDTYSDSSFQKKESFDVILFSYTLTMTGFQNKIMLIQALRDLKPGGIILVVDFHKTNYKFFEMHMKNNHVDMYGQIVPILEQHYGTLSLDIEKAYYNLWSYFTFVGIKPYKLK